MAVARRGTEVREQSREVRRLLRDARRAARGNHAAALPIFERALELAPSDERLMCETAFTALQASALERAGHLAGKALQRFGNPQQISESRRVPLAMCLYNAGRIAEAQTEAALARAHYEQSLALRENRVVRERWTAVGGTTEDEPEEPAVATLEALLERVASEVCESSASDGEGSRGGCERSIGQRVSASPSSTAFREAALLDVVTGAFGSEHYVYLAVRGSDGWRSVGVVLYVYNPGAFGIYQEGGVSAFAFEQLIPAGPEELSFEVEHDESDTDMGDNAVSSSSSRGLVICGVVDGRIRCSLLPRAHRTSRECLDPSADGEDGTEPCAPELPTEEQYALTHELEREQGRIRVRVDEGELPLHVRRWQGSHRVEDVLRARDLRVGTL